MYEFLQVAVKVVLIGATCLVAAIVSVRLWNTDLDLRTLFNPVRLLRRAADAQVGLFPARAPASLYQNGEVVAQTVGASIDEIAGVVTFEEIFNAKPLDRALDFEFQKWRLRFDKADGMIGLDTSAPEKGLTFQRVTCRIVGKRPF